MFYGEGKAFQTLKMSVLQSRHISDFSKGVNLWLSWKFEIWHFVFGQNRPKNIVCWCCRWKDFVVKIVLELLFDDVLDRKKGYMQTEEMSILQSYYFSKGVNPWLKL